MRHCFAAARQHPASWLAGHSVRRPIACRHKQLAHGMLLASPPCDAPPAGCTSRGAGMSELPPLSRRCDNGAGQLFPARLCTLKRQPTDGGGRPSLAAYGSGPGVPWTSGYLVRRAGSSPPPPPSPGPAAVTSSDSVSLLP